MILDNLTIQWNFIQLKTKVIWGAKPKPKPHIHINILPNMRSSNGKLADADVWYPIQVWNSKTLNFL